MGESRQPLSDAPTRANQGRRYSSLPAGIRGNGKKYRAPELVAIMGDGPVTAMQQDEVMRSERAATHSLRHKALHNAYAQQSDSGQSYRQPSVDLSARCERGYKINIGPWKLAHTLGKGASAEVKFCRHRVTGQPAACKIVSKHSSTLIQAGSLAALDRIDARMQQKLKNQMRVPVAVEREVAILKLVQHPNIMKLYDIWENGEYIYLILELVDDGDLFTLITRNGRLAEEAAISLFRQIMSAMTYCHYFKICHRDLKPENILVTHDGQVKIADFGMAALHQTETHKLHTACGSPHYAAPELLKAHHYLGNRADIWSMGVILFAMLTARLPFDEEEVSHVHAKVKRGEYEMPEFLSIEAKDLIRRMLEVNPDRRITMYDMWRHPLIMKYQAFDNLNPVTGQPPDVSLKFEPQPLRREEIDGQIVHQLRTLWHMFSEEDIVNNLVQKSPNTQQAFYWLLQNYRERQLEDFKPEIAHSRSDYHHFTPSAWKRKISTCEFTSGRSVSRFTVISQVAETEVETVASYDPYNVNKYSVADNTLASGNEPSRTKVTIHRRPSAHGQRDQSFSSTTQRIRRTGGTMASIRTARGTRIGPKTPSMGSMHSGKGVMYARPVPVHKRPAVNFTHIRRKSSAASRNGSIHVSSSGRGHSQRYMHGARGAHGSRDVRRRPSVKVPRPGTMQVSQTQDSALIDEEVRKFSSRIARDLDTAFNTSVVAEPSITGSLGLSSPTDTNEPKTPESFQSTDQTLVQDTTAEPGTWKDRPLPPLPERLKLLAASTQAKDDRRMVTAPAQLIRSNTNIEIFDTDADYIGKSSADKIRASSGPTRTIQRRGKGGEDKALRILENTENSIRVVNSPKRPLTGAGFMDRVMKDRKRESGTSMMSDYGRRASTVMPKLGYHDESVSKRKPSWFQRLSSYSHTNDMVEAGDRLYAHQRPDHGSDSSSVNGLQNKKKKRFGLLFWKTSKDGKKDADTTAPSISSITRAPTPKPQDPVHENWIARMFRIKPAMEYLCFDMSRKEARNDLADLFKEWKSFGMRDVAVDKDRNIVFARVSGKNSLGIKEVALAAEIMTVIEHGSNRPLSIVRFTQERGAASSFHTVVKTTKEVFSRRNKLVTDRQKSRMMIKTLNA